MTVNEFLRAYINQHPPTVAEISRATGLSSYQVRLRVTVLWLKVKPRGRAFKLVWAEGCTAWSRPLGGTPRPCMCCRKIIVSEGPHNRLCDTCRAKGGEPEPCTLHGGY